MAKKVLIITYYWPPSGGAGVQRWLKFAKYLRNFGWEPIIYTPENPEIPALDKSLIKDIPDGITVLKTKVWEPYTFYKRFVGIKKEDSIKAGFLSEKKKPSLTEKISVWIRGNYFIPDARKYWIKPSIKFLVKYLQDSPVDAIVSTGPPHSMHMIALGIKEKLNIPWLADFRDPWTNIDFYSELNLSVKADKKHYQLEKSVLKKADGISVISKTMASDFQRLHKRQYNIITNGFDESEQVDVDETRQDEKFSIAHIGSINKPRNPVALWKALSELLSENKKLHNDLEIKLVGPVDFSVKSYIEKYKLTEFVVLIDYIPHDEIIKLQKKSRVLLLIINNSPNAKMVVTGKLFEYLASGTPIVCIGPDDGDAADILYETKTGVVSGFNDVDKLKDNILIYYEAYKKGNLRVKGENISKYSRKNLTEDMAELLNKIIKPPHC